MPLYHFRNELVSSDNTHSSPLPFATKSMSVEGVEGVDGVVDGVVVDGVVVVVWAGVVVENIGSV